MSPNFDSHLGTLRSLESELISSESFRYGNDRREELLSAVMHLKDAIHMLRATGPSLRNDYRIQYLNDKLEDLVDKLVRTTREARSQGVVEIVVEEVSSYAEGVREFIDQGVAEENQQEVQRVNELEKSFLETQKRLNESQAQIERIRKNAEKAVAQAVKSAAQASKSASAATKIANKNISEEWTDEYSKYIDPDSDISSALKSLDKTKDEEIRSAGKIKRNRLKIKFFFKRLLVNPVRAIILYSGHSYVNASRKWRFWRSVYFTALLLVALAYLMYLWQHGLPPRDMLLDYLLKKAAFLPVVIVLSIGFVFASRNFRIAANKLEEYRHNYTVARNLRNLMNLPEVKDGNRAAMLLEKAVDTLFAYRPSGYINKGAGEDDFVNKLIDKLGQNREK